MNKIQKKSIFFLVQPPNQTMEKNIDSTFNYFYFNLKIKFNMEHVQIIV